MSPRKGLNDPDDLFGPTLLNPNLPPGSRPTEPAGPADAGPLGWLQSAPPPQSPQSAQPPYPSPVQPSRPAYPPSPAPATAPFAPPSGQPRAPYAPPTAPLAGQPRSPYAPPTAPYAPPTASLAGQPRSPYAPPTASPSAPYAPPTAPPPAPYAPPAASATVPRGMRVPYRDGSSPTPEVPVDALPSRPESLHGDERRTAPEVKVLDLGSGRDVQHPAAASVRVLGRSDEGAASPFATDLASRATPREGTARNGGRSRILLALGTIGGVVVVGAAVVLAAVTQPGSLKVIGIGRAPDVVQTVTPEDAASADPNAGSPTAGDGSGVPLASTAGGAVPQPSATRIRVVPAPRISLPVATTATVPTVAPTTAAPRPTASTAAPTTARPTTAPPSTAPPTTAAPTTAPPTSVAPTPTTAPPTSVAPSTVQPTPTIVPTVVEPSHSEGHAQHAEGILVGRRRRLTGRRSSGRLRG